LAERKGIELKRRSFLQALGFTAGAVAASALPGEAKKEDVYFDGEEPAPTEMKMHEHYSGVTHCEFVSN
jgi:hypothetical protein